MKPLSSKQKILGGVFLIVGTAWSLDMFTADSSPVAADASQANGQAVVPLPSEPADLELLIERVTQPAPVREPLPFDFLTRDCFDAAAALALDAMKTNPEHPGNETETDRPPEQPFDAQHRLQGIVAGRLPLALVDGRLLRPGALLDGYRLTEIRRDEVVFERDGDRVILRLPSLGRTEN